MSSLTEQNVSEYRRDGVLFPIPILTPEEVSRFREGLEDIERSVGRRLEVAELHQLHLHFPWAYELSAHPRVLDAVESLLGPDLMIWATSVFLKYPRNDSFVSWHQDATYWGLDSNRITTAWIALSDSAVGNGCMRVVPGSQTLPIQPHVETYAEENILSRGQEIARDVDEHDAVDVLLEPGEMSLHDVNIIHGSNPNGSDRHRIGFTVRFITPEVKPASDPDPVIVARGTDRFLNFPHAEAPSAGLALEQVIAEHAECTRKHLEGIRRTKGARE